jgi:hypothetical protein
MMRKHACTRIEELCFLRGHCRRINNGRSLGLISVVRLRLAGNGVNIEAEESSLLETVARKSLVKTLQAGEELACSDL